MCLNSNFFKEKEKIAFVVERCFKWKNYMPNANPNDLQDNKAFGEYLDK
jgi:hypothetical protein